MFYDSYGDFVKWEYCCPTDGQCRSLICNFSNKQFVWDRLQEEEVRRLLRDILTSSVDEGTVLGRTAVDDGCCCLMTNLPRLSLRSDGLDCAMTSFGARVCPKLSTSSRGLVSLFCLGFSGTGILGLLGSGRTRVSGQKGCSTTRLARCVSVLERNKRVDPGRFPICLSAFVASCLGAPTRDAILRRSRLTALCCRCTVGYKGGFITT